MKALFDSVAVAVALESTIGFLRIHTMGTHPIYPHLIVGAIALVVLAIRIQEWKAFVKQKREVFLSSMPRAAESKDKDERLIVGFFHPYCNAGGGGERVLWAAIAYLQRTQPDVISVVYSGDTDATKEEIIEKARARFGITLDPSTLAFVFLSKRSFIDAKTWPKFTMIGQSLGSTLLALEATFQLVPDIYIDTMGYAFTFPLISLISLVSTYIPIGAYVHYPTISTDMLERVRSRKSTYTNTSDVASSKWKSFAKLIYYRLFAQLYSACLTQSNKIVVNSSWTKNHIDSLIFSGRLNFLRRKKKLEKVQILYPPCDTTELSSFQLEGRERVVLSVAQFRPEKDHPAQLRAMSSYLEQHPEHRTGSQTVKLVLVGGCRDDEDAKRIEDLRNLANELKIKDNVEFVVNAPYSELKGWLQKASIGISTMVDEHFGINVVEYMAAGLIPLVHASGGPFNDIVVPLSSSDSENTETGYHAKAPEEYAERLDTILNKLSSNEIQDMRQRARTAAKRFSTEEFELGWSELWSKLQSGLADKRKKAL